MDIKAYAKHPHLVSFLKEIPQGAYLFKQGQMGRTLFLILGGVVELVAERDGSEHVESLVESGHFLGEKAIIQDTPHQRVYSARAQSDTTVIELALRDIERIQIAAPEVMTDMLRRTFQISAERLAKANYMIRALRSSDNRTRVVQCLSYYCRSSGKRTSEGIEVEIAVESIHYYIDMEKSEIESCLRELQSRGLMVKLSGDLYRVPDLSALLASHEDGLSFAAA